MDNQEQEKDTFVRNVAIAAAAGTALLVAVMLFWHLTRDTWEVNNWSRIVAKLDEADGCRETDPLTAYKAYDELLKEAQGHKIKNEALAKRLATAEMSRTTLYNKVKYKIQAEEAEKRRQAVRERRRIAEEKEREQAAEEARRLSSQKEQAETKRRKQAVSVYRNVPQSARSALNVVKKVEARTEIGINYRDYSTVVGEAWAEVKVFIESPNGKSLPELTVLLTKAIADYKSALDVWRSKIEFPSLASAHEHELETLQQLCWRRAGIRLRLAESLLDPEKTTKTLEMIAGDQERAEDFDAELNRILLRK